MNVEFRSVLLLLTTILQTHIVLGRVLEKREAGWGFIDKRPTKRSELSKAEDDEEDTAWLNFRSLLGILNKKRRENNAISNLKPDFNELEDVKTRHKFIFDPKYMSIKKPRNKTRSGVPSKRELMLTMPEELKNLPITVPGSLREHRAGVKKKLRLWMWNMAYCPILEAWEDFGDTFWPRYVNRGRCSRAKTCSYPEGMKCRKDKIEEIYIYWWDCIKPSSEGKPCSWRKFSFDVTATCKCKCQTNAGVM